MPDISEFLDRVPTTHYINGAFTTSERTLEVMNPATGGVLTSVADADPDVAQRAMDAAADAQADWASTEPRVRGEYLRTAFELIHERADDFTLAMTLEMGKPLAESKGEVGYGAEFFRWFSEEAVRIHGRWMTAPTGNSRLVVMKQPVGPVYAITPWNFPLAMATRKLGPAIAAGCTSILKPASATPLTALLLMQVLDDVGLPPGVVNCFVTSDSGGTTERILADDRLRKLTFTGSTAVGVSLQKQAAEKVLRTSMELGGNAPFVVLASADVDKAVEGAVAAKMRNIGEACTAANRMLVHDAIAEEFTVKFAERLSNMKVGNGVDDGVTVGPLIDAKALDDVELKVREAVDAGARLVTGGSRAPGDGYFMQPTVLADVPTDARILREEIFGPVAPILTFSSVDEALRMANDTRAGLIAYVYGENLAETLTVVERLETGMVGVNSGVVSNPAAPFGGVKESGLGREGGFEGIEEYLETKYVGLAID